MAQKLGKGIPESPNFPHKFGSEFRVGNIRQAGALGVKCGSRVSPAA
jgi:hypothetical protein